MVDNETLAKSIKGVTMSPPEGQSSKSKHALEMSKVQDEVVSLLSQATPRIQQLIKDGDGTELALLTNDLLLDLIDRVKMKDGSSTEAALRRAFATYAASCAIKGSESPVQAAGKAILSGLIASACKLLQGKAIKELNAHKRQKIASERRLERSHPSSSTLTSKSQKHILATLMQHSQEQDGLSYHAIGPDEGVLETTRVQLDQAFLLSGSITGNQDQCLKAINDLDELMNNFHGDNQALLSAAVASIKNRYAHLFNRPKSPNIAQTFQAIKQESNALLVSLSQVLEANMRGEVSTFVDAVRVAWKEGVKGFAEKAVRHLASNDTHTESNIQAIKAHLGRYSLAGVASFDFDAPLSVPKHMQPSGQYQFKEGMVGKLAEAGKKNAEADSPAMKVMIAKMDTAAVAYVRDQAAKGGLKGVAMAALAGGKWEEQAIEGANQAVTDFAQRMLQNIRAADFQAHQQHSFNQVAIPEGDWGRILNRMFGNELVRPEGSGAADTSFYSISNSPITQLNIPLKAASKAGQLAVELLKSYVSTRANFFNAPISEKNRRVLQLKHCIHELLVHAMTKKTLLPKEVSRIQRALQQTIHELKRLNPKDRDLSSLSQLNQSELQSLANTMRLTDRRKQLNPNAINALPAEKTVSSRYHSKENAPNSQSARVKAMDVNDAIDHIEEITQAMGDACLHIKNPKEYSDDMGKSFDVGNILNNPYAHMATQVSHKRHWSPMKHTASTLRLTMRFKKDSLNSSEGNAARETIYSLARILMSHGETRNPVIGRALADYDNDHHMAARAIAENANRIPNDKLADLITDVGNLSRQAKKYDYNQTPRAATCKQKVPASNGNAANTPTL